MRFESEQLLSLEDDCSDFLKKSTMYEEILGSFTKRIGESEKITNKQRSNAYQNLNAEIDKIARRRSPDAYSLITSIERQIRQFRLENTISVETLISESYLRAIRYIDQGGVINNPKAWLRKTAFNIVREQSRQRKRQLPVDPQSHILEIAAPETPEQYLDNALLGDDELRLKDRWKIFQEALEELITTDPEQGRILRLRLIDKLSWEEIRQVIIAEDGDAPTIQTLRKQGSRAKSVLRQIYHQREEHLYLVQSNRSCHQGQQGKVEG